MADPTRYQPGEQPLPGLAVENNTLNKADADTLKHLMSKGVGPNTLRALRSDFAYLEAWHGVVFGTALQWPPNESTVLTFIAHHLWDPDEKARNPDHGMPDDIQDILINAGALRSRGPHAPSTVRRRLSSWRSLCAWQNVDHPFAQKTIKKAIQAAAKSADRPRVRKSKKSVDIELIQRLLAHLDGQCETYPLDAEDLGLKLRAHRDRAILSTMFASGGRRRSEISSLMMSQVLHLDPIAVQNPDWPNGLPSLGIRLGRTKSTDGEDDPHVFMTGRAVEILLSWIELADIREGPIFRRISRYGHIYDTSISDHSVNMVLKKRLSEIGESPTEFSAHGVRAGYISSALKEGIPAPEVMEQTLHRSLKTFLGYFKDEQQRQSRAARLL